MTKSGAGAQALRVLIVSRQAIVRAGLGVVLAPFGDRVKVVGEVEGVDEALSEAVRSGAQVVLFDAHLGAGDLDEIERFARGLDGRHLVVLARRDETRFTWPVLRRGASGFLLETVAGAELVDHLEHLSRGDVVVDSALAGGVREDELGQPWPGSHLGLTEEESQVLELLSQGEALVSVGSHLGITTAEVKVHVKSAYRRLAVPDRSAALARLTREGLFS